MKTSSKRMGKNSGLSLSATLRKYIALSSLQDKIFMLIGLIAGVINGVFFVSRLFLYAIVLDIFREDLAFEERLSHLNFSIKENVTSAIRDFHEEVIKDQPKMNFVITLYSLLLALGFIASYVQVMTWETVCRKQTHRLRTAFFEHALRLEMSWHDQMERSDDLNVQLNDDIERVGSTLGSRVPFMVQCMTTVPLTVACIFVVDWMLGTAVLVGILIIFCSSSLTGRMIRKIATEEQKVCREAGYFVSEILTSLKIVKSFGREECAIHKFSQHVANEKKIALKKNFSTAFQYSLDNGVLFLILSCCIYICSRALESPEAAFGFLVSCVGFFRQTSSAFSDSVPFLGELLETLVSCSNVFAFLETPIHIDPTSDKGVRVDKLDGDICFKNVTFYYPSRKDTKILENFNMIIPKGKTVAIVGESGAGKTTILGLIMRFFDPVTGEVSINGIKISDMSVGFFRKRMAVVSQEPVLFDGTVEENIRYGNMDASFGQIRDAAQLANAHDFITSLPQGYSTMVGERGSMLSGGQKQRIVIARALIRDPDIILLDEATSALDNHSERAIQETLDQLSKGRTTVIVSHKLNAIKNADIIFVMKNGRIVESGNHQQLLAKQGAYYSLISQQNEEEHKPDVSPKSERQMKRNAKERLSYNRNSFELNIDLMKRVSVDLGFDINNVDTTTFEPTSQYPSFPVEVGGWFMFASILGMSKSWVIVLGVICCSICGLPVPLYYVLFTAPAVQMSALPLNTITEHLRGVSLEFVYLAVAFFVFFFCGIVCAARTADDTIAALRIKMLKSALSQRYSYFDNAGTSATNVANAINQKPFHYKNVGGTKVGDMCGVLVFAVAAFTISFFYFWRIALVQLIFVPIMIVSSNLQVRSKLFIQRKKDEQKKESSKFAALCFDNIKAVHCLSLHKYLNERYQALCMEQGRKEFRSLNILAIAFSLIASMPCAIAIVNFSIGYSWFLEGKGPAEALVINTPLFGILFNSLAGIILYVHNFGSSMPSVKYAFNMINSTEESIAENDSKKIEIQGKIEFKDVSFSYEGSNHERKVLSALNLTIEPGTIVALVGPSGCGKSTIINLIEKFYDTDDGIILVDGKDIRQISDEKMRQSISLVTQEPLLFNETIRQNILYGLKKTDTVSEERLIECCKQANIHKFVTSLPQGYDTVVGARGSQLSGGQKQRIAIARALVRDPKILLLDEATSALDSESEKEVQAALNEASKGRTTITVAHRLSTIKEANVIAVMNNGRIVEKGTHDELVRLGGRYYEMLMDQC